MAAIAIVGGFRAAPPAALPRVEPGEPVETERWDISVVRAWRSATDPSSESDFASEGRYLAVELDVTVTAPQSISVSGEFQRGLRVELPSGFTIDGDVAESNKYRPIAVLSRDLTLAQAHPGLPARIRAVYELPAKEPWPSRAEIVIYQWEYESGFLDESLRWRVPVAGPESSRSAREDEATDRRELARVVLPVMKSPP